MPAYGRVGTKAFTFSAAARPRSGQRRAGKKEGVLGEGIFARPPEISVESLPTAAGSGLKVSVGVFLIESSDFFQQTPH